MVKNLSAPAGRVCNAPVLPIIQIQRLGKLGKSSNSCLRWIVTLNHFVLGFSNYMSATHFISMSVYSGIDLTATPLFDWNYC